MLKWSALIVVLASHIMSHAQIGEPIGEQEKKAATTAPECRQLMMVQDCNGYVYTEYVNVNGREEEIIFHRKSGKPFTGDCKVCYNNGKLKMHVNYVNWEEDWLDKTPFIMKTVESTSSPVTTRMVWEKNMALGNIIEKMAA